MAESISFWQIPSYILWLAVTTLILATGIPNPERRGKYIRDEWEQRWKNNMKS